MASGISYSVKIALVIAWVMAGDQKLKSHPEGLNFDDAVGNPGHSITHTTYWQKPPFFFPQYSVPPPTFTCYARAQRKISFHFMILNRS